MRGLTWVVLLGLLAVFRADAGTIEVTGAAELSKPVETAQLTASVELTEQSVAAAKDKVDGVIAKALVLFERNQIAANRYRAATLQIAPRYNYRSEQREFIGYQASRSVELTVAVDEVGLWLERFSELGFNQIQSPSYTNSLTSAERDGLFEQALEDALHKAKVLAQASGQRLGKVVEIKEMGDQQARPMMRMAAMEDASSYHGGDASSAVRLRVVVALER